MSEPKDNSVTPGQPTPLALSPEAAALKPKQPVAPHKAGEPESLQVEEKGGPKGPEPTRFGDWERKGRCSDF